jgi:hypothetical protein
MADTAGIGPNGPPQPTHTVVASGSYGTVLWIVCKPLWDILPTAGRERALDASARVIGPFFVKLVEDLLTRLDLDAAVAGLAGEWSLEVIEEDCSYGVVVWQIGQGAWEAMPLERRANLIALMKTAIHAFFHQRVHEPLLIYAIKNLPR